MKKKLIVLGLITALTFCMVACGNNDKSDNEITTATETNENDNTKNNEENFADDKTDSTDDGVDKKDELTDEYLLSLPETSLEEFWYEEIEGGIIIKSCFAKNDENGIIVVPNQIDGKDVIEIGNEAFVRCHFKAVVLNENLKIIGGSCFLDAEVDKVLIQEGVEIIGGQAFYLGKYNEINIPSTVKTIATNSFGSTNIKKVTIPKSVESIYVSAFSSCDELETITFEGCPKIEFGAFIMCDNIKKVVCLDGNISFDKDEFCSITGEPKDITFVAPAGSNVEQYAKDNGFKFEALN